MAISTSRVTAQVLALTSGGATTTLNKDQLDALLNGTTPPSPGAGGGTGSTSGVVSQFTSQEVATLKALAAGGFTAQQVQSLKNLSALNLTQAQIMSIQKIAGLNVDWQDVGAMCASDRLKQLAVSDGYAICSKSLDYIEQVTESPTTLAERTFYILVQPAIGINASPQAASLPVPDDEPEEPQTPPILQEGPSIEAEPVVTVPETTSPTTPEVTEGPANDLEIIPPIQEPTPIEGPSIEPATISAAPMMTAEVAQPVATTAETTTTKKKAATKRKRTKKNTTSE